VVNDFKNRKILLVVAHPDDEVLGLGATMHRLIHEQNCEVHVVILGEGITSRLDSRDVNKWEKELEIHKENIQSAKKAIGFHSVKTFDFPDNRFDTVPLLDIIKTVEHEKNAFKPEIIFTHHGGDVNIDHQRTFEAVVTACRPLTQETVRTIISFETPSGTEWRASSDPKHFLPNLFYEVSEKDVKAKILAMESYEFEKRAYPHPRSPEALKIQAQRWGIVIGCDLAEAFCLVRSVQIAVKK